MKSSRNMLTVLTVVLGCIAAPAQASPPFVAPIGQVSLFPVPSGIPAGANPAWWHVPVNPGKGVPADPASTIKPRFGPAGLVREITEPDCYPAGSQANLYNDCVSPGYEHNTGTIWMDHWGQDPYTGSGLRYVWVDDHLQTNSREQQWLQYIVNQMNSYRGSHGSTGPYFLYAAHPGPTFNTGDCNTQPQYINVCYTYNGDTRSRTYFYVDSIGHFQHDEIYLNYYQTPSGGASDYLVSDAVIHEFGHTLGYHHDTDPSSVMTYATTFGNQYLGYAVNQTTEYAGLYQANHPAN